MVIDKKLINNATLKNAKFMFKNRSGNFAIYQWQFRYFNAAVVAQQVKQRDAIHKIVSSIPIQAQFLELTITDISSYACRGLIQDFFSLKIYSYITKFYRCASVCRFRGCQFSWHGVQSMIFLITSPGGIGLYRFLEISI